MELNIVQLWPDAMNRNGSQGNLLCLRRRLEWRDFGVSVRSVALGEPLDLTDCDLLYLGAGTPYENPALHEAVRAAAPVLRAYVERGGVFLAVCEGFELMGERVLLPDGTEIEGAGVGGFSTAYAKKRITGNLTFRHGELTVAAFENHASYIVLQAGQEPLGTVLTGQGNNDLDDTVGLRYKNFFGCSAYSLLPLNPALADEILSAALEVKYGSAELAPLDDSFEDRAREKLLRRMNREA